MLAAPQYAVTKRLGRVYPPGAAAADGRGEDPPAAAAAADLSWPGGLHLTTCRNSN
jgi:hypothetical protein